MEDLSLHVLDLVRNSIEAGAKAVQVKVVEDRSRDELCLEISDDGRGMDPSFAAVITDPFVTSRSTREVGLGLALVDEAARRSGGRLEVESAAGRGTTVRATFGLSHVDRPPLGDMAATLMAALVGNPRIRLTYIHRVGDKEFRFDTEDVRARLGDGALEDLEVLRWVGEYCREGIESVRGGELV